MWEKEQFCVPWDQFPSMTTDEVALAMSNQYRTYLNMRPSYVIHNNLLLSKHCLLIIFIIVSYPFVFLKKKKKCTFCFFFTF
jgi:hypothetical protein